MAGLFNLTFNKNRDSISITGTRIVISVYSLELEPFEPLPGSMVFYGDDHGDLLAFEAWPLAHDPENNNVATIAAAIKWYAKEKLDYPDMELSIDDPRVPRRSILVN